MPSLRTFIAIETPESIRHKIQAVQQKLKQAQADVRWESVKKFHATVKFLGDVEEKEIKRVLSTIQSTAGNHQSFELTVGTFGCFPNKKRPRVIWIGIQNTDGVLDLLKTALDISLLAYGFEIEDRAFHPHITLGRVKSDRGIPHLLSLLEKVTFEPQKFKVNELVLMKSILQPEGSVYEVLGTTALQT